MAENLYKVKLRSRLTNVTVTFDIVPDVSEQRNVEYKAYNPIHGPGTIYTFSHSASRVIAVNNARLISRTPQEAARNLAKLQILRSWTLPYFGNAQANYLGLPPDVLSFFAFARGPSVRSQSSDSKSTTPGPQTLTSADEIRRTPAGITNLHNIPTVINNLQITYPSDIDYIPTAADEFPIGDSGDSIVVNAGEPFPTVMTVDIQLFETQSPADFNRFSLADYRSGKLGGF
jgi:hypothetical protein